ncbi:MarR family winged helix-turn-helix transcriptional regulator [Shewanella sp. UCD-KL12]|uniref:MarR family winged helix-turn-helix transcriptional regulator n=1 Tax=Shewanella sp. UCD-KL12 TaxID=1917163 RepID=UPI0009707EFC|nr:MarR family transcriptional regulator [Shewanella sp. UCD-KL12]
MEDILQLNEANWPECAATSYPALLRLTQVNNIFIQLIKECVESYGLQSSDFNLLCSLRRNPPPHLLSPTDLYQSMLFSSGGLTKVLIRLQKEELIERCENPDDKRSKLVKLSQKGKLLVEEIMPVLHKRENDMVAALSAEDLAQLDDLMMRIMQSMNSKGQIYPTRVQFMGASKN